MSAIKKLVLANLEATKARLSEGRQWIGIKNLEAPDEVQPRAGIDKDWVSQLATFRREGSEFPPARVYQLPDGRLILAEGHHRRWALLGDGAEDMLCDVVDGTMEDAVAFAAGSNKSNGVKPMSPKDITKAIEMLFSIERYWKGSDLSLAKHIGCSASKMGIVRRAYSTRTGTPIPADAIRADGKRRGRVTGRYGSRSVEIIERPGFGFRARYRGVEFYGGTMEEIKKRLQAEFARQDRKGNFLKKVERILRQKDFKTFKWFSEKWPGFQGWHGNGMVATICDFSEATSLAAAAGNAKIVAIAVGRLIVARQASPTSTRSVIVCWREDGPKSAINLLEEAGYEFMTPDELIASLGPVIPDELKHAPTTSTD